MEVLKHELGKSLLVLLAAHGVVGHEDGGALGVDAQLLRREQVVKQVAQVVLVLHDALLNREVQVVLGTVREGVPTDALRDDFVRFRFHSWSVIIFNSSCVLPFPDHRRNHHSWQVLARETCLNIP